MKEIKKTEFKQELHDFKAEDLLERAAMISKVVDPDEAFYTEGGLKKEENTFGALVLCDGRPTMNKMVPHLPPVTDRKMLSEVARMVLESTQEKDPWTLARELYVQAAAEYSNRKTVNEATVKLLHRLETSKRNARQQGEWLKNENTSRVTRKENFAREIEDYEKALNQTQTDIQLSQTGMIDLAKEMFPLRNELVEKEQHASELAKRHSELLKKSGALHSLAHPLLAAKEKHEIRQIAKELKGLKKELEQMHEKMDTLSDQKEELNVKKEEQQKEYDRLNKQLDESKDAFDQVLFELTGGQKMSGQTSAMMANLTIRINTIEAQVKETDAAAELARKTLVKSANNLIRSFTSSSSKARAALERLRDEEELHMEDVEVLFFVLGVCSASGTTGCSWMEECPVKLKQIFYIDLPENDLSLHFKERVLVND